MSTHKPGAQKWVRVAGFRKLQGKKRAKKLVKLIQAHVRGGRKLGPRGSKARKKFAQSIRSKRLTQKG